MVANSSSSFLALVEDCAVKDELVFVAGTSRKFRSQYAYKGWADRYFASQRWKCPEEYPEWLFPFLLFAAIPIICCLFVLIGIAQLEYEE